VSSNAGDLLHNVLEATNVDDKVYSVLDPFDENKSRSLKVPSFSEAGYQAISTLAFVCPDIVLPHVLSKISSDIAENEASTLDATDFAIWQTPEGTLYIDGVVKVINVGIMLTFC
jgi:hypothetical protein